LPTTIANKEVIYTEKLSHNETVSYLQTEISNYQPSYNYCRAVADLISDADEHGTRGQIQLATGILMASCPKWRQLYGSRVLERLPWLVATEAQLASAYAAEVMSSVR